MKKNSYPGKFIVFEGPDGSGKSTQGNLLKEYLKREGYEVAEISFPQYGTKSAGLVEEYLSGKYGKSEEVEPYQASIFYACDRYDASFKIREWLKEGKIIISNRYVASNIGHQGGKIEDTEERRKFIKWLYSLEYEIFKIPRPDITFLLKISPEFSEEMATQNIDRDIKKQAYLFEIGERDIHENIAHLSNAFSAYLEAAREFPEDFIAIECVRDGKLFHPEIIHQQILKFITRIL